MALKITLDDAGYGVIETKLSVIGRVRRLAADVFADRAGNDAALKRRRTDQLECLQKGSLQFLQDAFALASAGGSVRSKRLAGRLVCKLYFNQWLDVACSEMYGSNGWSFILKLWVLGVFALR